MRDPATLPWRYADTFLDNYAPAHERQQHGTAYQYARSLARFAAWVQAAERDGYDEEQPWPLDPAALTTETVLAYVKSLQEDRSWATVRGNMSAIVGYLDYLEAHRLLPDAVSVSQIRAFLRQRRQRANVTASRNVLALDKLRMQHVPEMVRYFDTLPLPDPEQCDYNEHLTLLRNRALMRVLYATAMRISEVVRLDRRDVRSGVDYVVITGKRNKQRAVHLMDYVHEPVQAYLQARIDTSNALFVSHSRNSKGKRLTANSVGIIAKEAARAIGAEELSAHDIRHFRATQLLRRGVPLEVVQEYLGHEDIGTTRNVYAPVIGVARVREWLDQADDADFEQMAERHAEEWQSWEHGDDQTDMNRLELD